LFTLIFFTLIALDLSLEMGASPQIYLDGTFLAPLSNFALLGVALCTNDP